MASSLYNELNGCGNQSNQTPNNSFSSDPRFTAIASTNPMAAQILREAQASGMTLKDMFYQRASQRGVNPNTILNQLRNRF